MSEDYASVSCCFFDWLLFRREYVQWALRVQREDPELFEKIWNGRMTICAAIRELDGVTETESARRTRTLRRELNILFRDPAPRFLERLEQVVAEFRDAGCCAVRKPGVCEYGGV